MVPAKASFMWVVYFEDLIDCVHVSQVQSTWQNCHSCTTVPIGLSIVRTSQTGNNQPVGFTVRKVTLFGGEYEQWLLKKVSSCVYIVPFSFQNISTYIMSFLLIL